MKRLRVIAIVVLAGGALALLIFSHQRATSNRALARSTPEMEEVPQVSPEPVKSETHEASDAAAPEAFAPNGTKILPGPVPIARPRHSLAAAAEPPAGPEITPGLTPLTVLENMRSVFRQYSQRYGGN